MQASCRLLVLNSLNLCHPKYFKLHVIPKSKKNEFIEDRFHQNIWRALNQKTPSILKDDKGKEIAIFNVGELFKEKEGRIHVYFGSIDLKVKGNFVGLGHIQYSPDFFGAQSTQEVLDA